MSIAFQDLLAMGPISCVSIIALVVLTVESLYDKTEQLNCWISIVGLTIAGVIGFETIPTSGVAFDGMVTTGGYAGYFAMVFAFGGVLCVLLSHSYIKREEIEHGEYYSLMLFAIVGMMLMAAAADLIIFFLGLELMSIAFYVLAGFSRHRQTSNEAALKYFLLGAFATGFLLYGIALVYGTSGTTNISSILSRIGLLGKEPAMLIGLGLLLVGLAFKIAAVPFHMWVPDVYEGSPTTVTAFMSTGGKAAAFSAIVVIFAPSLMNAIIPIRDIIAGIAALSMVVGNVLALSQTSIKRMLAYSSIAHAGYILAGVVAANSFGMSGVLFYLVAYTIMNIGAFGVLSMLESKDGQHLTFEDYTGLAAAQPALAALMAMFMFSLTGIPPFAGFFGKYYVFAGAIAAGYTWLAIIGVLMSVVSAYYYLRLVVLMYFKEQASFVRIPDSKLGFFALVISAIALVGFGLFPDTLLNLTSHFF